MKKRRAVRRQRQKSAPRKPLSWTFRLVASFITFVVVMGGLEILAREAAPQIPKWRLSDNTGVIMTGHPTRLWGMGVGKRQNGDAWATINENGLRGAIPVVPRPADTQRILVLGDSTWFGHGVEDDQTTPAILERDLKAMGVNVEVVNGAIPGYSTEQSKLVLEELGWAMEPTLLLLCNLWSDNNVDGFRDTDLLRTSKVFSNNLLAQSALFQVMAGAIDRARGGTGAHIITWTKSSKWPEVKERRVPLQDYATNLDFMIREARSRGIGAALVAPANSGLVNNEFPNGAGWDPYFAAQKAVAEWHELPLANATEALQANATATDQDFVDLMHPSAIGHEAIAAQIAKVLTDAGWPGKPLLGKEAAFDASGLVDDGTLNAGGQPAKMSPQGQLFPNVVDDSPTGSPQNPDKQQTGGQDVVKGEAPPGAPGGEPVEPGSPGSAPPSDDAWSAWGIVTGGTGEITVTIAGADGKTVATTTPSTTGEFSMDVPAGLTSVSITATDSAGHSVKGALVAGGDGVSLSLPQ